MDQAYWYQEVESTADKALRVEARTLAGIYTGAAIGMFRLMRQQILGGQAKTIAVKHFLIQGIDAEVVLVDWLERLLEESDKLDTFNTLGSVTVRIANQYMIQATAYFIDNVDQLGAQIKAATFHDLVIVDRGEVAWPYLVTVTFDV